MKLFNRVSQHPKRIYGNFYLVVAFLFFSQQLLPQSTLYPSPLTAPVGAAVNINIVGGNMKFNSNSPLNNYVYFGGVRATVLSVSDNQITTTVPAGSFFAPITVTNQSNQTAYSWRSFISTFENNAIPTLSQSSIASKIDFPAGTGAAGVASGDFNGDGRTDVVVTNFSDNTVSIFHNISNYGSELFAAKQDLLTDNVPTNVAIADMDGDGKLDMVVTNSGSNTVSVFRNTTTTQNISFADRVNFNTGNTPYMCTLNDFDGDGKTDIAVINRSSDNTVSILRNTSITGQISFAARMNFTTGNFPIAITSGDLNQDSKPDLAIVNYFANTVSVLKNNSIPGNFFFDTKADFITGAFPISVAIGDINKDFRQDLVVANFVDNSVSVLKHNVVSSQISFDAKIDFASGLGPAALAINDIDGDGALDMVTANQTGNNISVFKNTSDPALQIPAFNSKLDFATDNFPSQIFMADFDNNGKPDITTANTNGKSISVLLNKAGDDAPRISNVDPISASSGEVVYISGGMLSNVTAVSFGGAAADTFITLNDNFIVAIVGRGASGKVVLTSNNGIASYAGFVYKYDPGPLRIINTIAGNGASSYSGDGGNALGASFSNLFALSIDTTNGNVCITDGNNNRMRKLNASNGIITTLAGNGTQGFSGDGGPAIAAQIKNPQGGSAFDKLGNLFFADMLNNRIRKVDALTGIISTVAGGGDFNFDGIPATIASIGPRGVAVDTSGNLFIVDNTNNKIRKVDVVTGIISTIAGTGVKGYNGDSILATNAKLNSPQNIAFDKSGNLFIADLSNYRIRKVDMASGIITTVIGNGILGSEGDGGLAINAQINGCWSIAVDTANNLYIAENTGSRVRMVDAATGIITTIAGTGTPGFFGDGGNATQAQIGYPIGIVVDKKQNVYVTDNGNRVRKIGLFNSDITVCPNGATSFVSDVLGSVYKWQFDGGSGGTGFLDISPSDGGFVGVSNPTLSIPKAYSFLNTWQFRCLVNGVPGKTFTLKITDSWNGSVSTAWENPANWNCNTLPDYGTDVFINSGTVIINSNVSCRSVVVKQGANVIVTPGFNLTITH